MKISPLIVILLLIQPMIGFSQDQKFFGRYIQPKKGDTVYSFAPCDLKSRADINANTVEKLGLGELLIIDSVYTDTHTNTWVRPKFYRVKHKMNTRFIECSNVAIYKLNTATPQQFFLVHQYFFADTTPDVLKFVVIKNGKVHTSYMQKLIGEQYSISMTDARGLDGISALIHINYYAQACGEESGETIITWDDQQLNELVSLSSSVDGDAFSSFETIILPKDSGGMEGKIIYKKEVSELMEEDTNWYKTTKEEREYLWINKRMQPAFRSKPVYE